MTNPELLSLLRKPDRLPLSAELDREKGEEAPLKAELDREKGAEDPLLAIGLVEGVDLLVSSKT